jgi:hypothetical protein
MEIMAWEIGTLSEIFSKTIGILRDGNFRDHSILTIRTQP